MSQRYCIAEVSRQLVDREGNDFVVALMREVHRLPDHAAVVRRAGYTMNSFLFEVPDAEAEIFQYGFLWEDK